MDPSGPLGPWDSFVWAVTLTSAVSASNSQCLGVGKHVPRKKAVVDLVKHGRLLWFPRPVPWDARNPNFWSPKPQNQTRQTCVFITLGRPRDSYRHHSASTFKSASPLLRFLIPSFLQSFSRSASPAPLIGSPPCATRNTSPFPFLLSLHMQIAGECPRGPCKGLGNDERKLSLFSP